MASTSSNFKDGVIFCELLGIYRKSALEAVLRDGPPTIEKSFRNISIAISEIKNYMAVPPSVTTDSVYNSEDSMFELLKCIKTLFITQPEPIIDQQKLATAKFPHDELSLGAVELDPTIKSPSFANLGVIYGGNKNQKNDQETVNASMRIEESQHKQQVIKAGERRFRTENNSVNTSVIPPKNQNIVSVEENVLRNTSGAVVAIKKREGHMSAESTSRLMPPRLSSEREGPAQYYSSRRLSSQQNRENVMPSRTTQNDGGYVNPVHVPKVDIRAKYKIIKWLQEIRLIKESGISIAEFPSYCRDGVLLSNLIFRLEGV